MPSDEETEIRLDARNAEERRTLWWVLGINFTQVLVAGAVGVLADSTGLLGAALDNLGDAAVYAVSIYAVGRTVIAKARAANLSGILLILVALGLLLEIFRRFFAAAEPIGLAMIVTALANAATNLLVLRLLRAHRAHGVHLKASWIFTTNDMVVNVGIVLSGVLVMLLKSPIPDLLIGIVVVGIVFKGGWEILGEAREAREAAVVTQKKASDGRALASPVATPAPGGTRRTLPGVLGKGAPMPRIPRDESFDSTLSLIRDPYRFISKRCRRYEADLFETRLLLRKTICMTGPETARLFYDPSRFERHDAMPKAVQKTLLGQAGVQGLDGEAHRRRKQMFMSLMTPERIEQLVLRAAEEWQIRVRRWASSDEVVLYTELHELLMRAVCAWAGVPLVEQEIDARTREIAALFDHAGSVGIRHLWSRWARKRADHWMAQIIGNIRSGHAHPPEQSAAHIISWHRDAEGELLPPHVAAVELINVVRPTVAVSVYVIFIAHALHEHPELQERLASGDEGYAECFVQEVRRYYPFFPAVAARTRQAFEWNGYQFPEGRQVILDLYGTNRDPRTWERPEEFDPERFRRWDESRFNFVPQGGGDHHVGHRCPGEWIAIELMKLATEFLTRRMRYEVPQQDLRIDWSRMPPVPRSRFVIRNVRASSDAEPRHSTMPRRAR